MEVGSSSVYELNESGLRRRAKTGPEHSGVRTKEVVGAGVGRKEGERQGY